MAKPQNCITVNEAKTLYQNWQNSRAPKLVRGLDPEVSDVVFTLAEMEELQVGDSVKSDNGKFSSVYGFGHRMVNDMARYYRFEATSTSSNTFVIIIFRNSWSTSSICW